MCLVTISVFHIKAKYTINILLFKGKGADCFGVKILCKIFYVFTPKCAVYCVYMHFQENVSTIWIELEVFYRNIVYAFIQRYIWLCVCVC